MRSFFILMATTALVQAVDLAKMFETESNDVNDWVDDMNLAQVEAPRPRSTSLGGRPRTTSTTSPSLNPLNTINRTRTNSSPTLTAATTRPSRTSTVSTRPSITRPSNASRPSIGAIPDRSSLSSSRGGNLSVPDRNAGRSRAASTAVFPGLPQSRQGRLSTVSTVNSQSLPESRASRADSAQPAAVTQQQWSAADKLVVGTTILQLPAMIAETTMASINSQKQLELSREQFQQNYDLAVTQNDQVEAQRLLDEEVRLEQAAKDAKAAEIAAIWRAQQAVVDDWAETMARSDALEEELLAVYAEQDALDALCGDVDTAPAECDTAWADSRALQDEEDAIWAQFAVIDAELAELLEVQEELADLEEAFCQDPGEFATDCLAI